MAERGSWVEVQRTVLEPAQRTSDLPSDTAAVPYVARICGYLVADTALGSEAEIETVIGRRVRGTLLAVNPPFDYGFGRPVPELLRIGNELRALLPKGPD